MFTGAAATVAGIVFTSLALAPVTAGSSIFIGLGIGAGVVGSAGVGTGIGQLLSLNNRWHYKHKGSDIK